MKKGDVPHWFFKALFLVYLLLLFYLVLFSEAMGRGAEARPLSYNFVLFQEIKRFWKYREQLGFWAVFLNLFGNVLAFMPLGVFLPALWKRCRNIFLVLVMSGLVSVFIETLQLYFNVGSFDVDDIFLNTLGGILGYILYWIWKQWFGKQVQR